MHLSYIFRSFSSFFQVSANFEPMLERLTQLENNFSLLLSRDRDIKPYSSLDEALQAPSRFSRPVTAKVSNSGFIWQRKLSNSLIIHLEMLSKFLTDK